MRNIILLILAGFCLYVPAMAAAEPSQDPAAPGFRETGRPLPRFASLRSDKIYVRAGPAMRYPIRWIYTRAGLPVEIIQEFDAWRKIRDAEGEEGWVHQSLLSGARTALVRVPPGGDVAAVPDPVPVRAKAEAGARLVARLEPQVQVGVEECHGAWCRVEAQGYKGWAERKFLWGVYESEEFD